jgi:hypothetical protein
MNKIFAGIVGLMLVVGVTSGTAYALFSSKATASGVTFATGNADLRIWDGSGWASDWNPSFDFSKLYPGYSDSKPFSLYNNSTSPIALNIAAKLLGGASGDWDALKDVISVAVNLSDDSAGTGWHTLNEWYTTGYSLPGNPVNQSTQADYKFYVTIDSTATDVIASKSLTGATFEFTGTQN